VMVRPVKRGEIQRWRRLMAQFHYLGDGELVGESLRYVAESECGWLALLGWNVAAWKSRYREAYIGWDERTKQQRLRFVINNSRFLILPWVRVPHLASSVLGANLRRLSSDWVERYGHPIVLAETFVDLERFRGTCYRAANWTYLGRTRATARASWRRSGIWRSACVSPAQTASRRARAGCPETWRHALVSLGSPRKERGRSHLPAPSRWLPVCSE
jgi:hypothetical protein